MALETLKGVEKIGGFAVGHDATENRMRTGSLRQPIFVDHINNEILFRIQNGPIKENGVNGCQVDTLIHAARMIIVGLNDKFPSEYNRAAILGLEIALGRLNDRTRDRENRNVEGTSKA